MITNRFIWKSRIYYYLNVFEEWQALAPLDNLVESMIGNAAHTRDRIALPTTTTGGCRTVAALAISIATTWTVRLRSAAAMLLSLLFVGVPQVLYVHNFEQKLWH